MRQCTQQDFEAVSALDEYQSLVSFAGEDRLICPDLDAIALEGGLASPESQIVQFEVIAC
jgi:hypothetical protein